MFWDIIFFYDFNGKKIFALYDVPHLVKSVRNTLMKADIEFNGGCVASFDIIRALYNEDNLKPTKILTKITYKHVFPNTFEKMRVSLAAQVFSLKVATAFRSAYAAKKEIFRNSKGEDISYKALDTANFCEIINNVFDCLNCNSMNIKQTNKYKRPISKNNDVVKHLEESLVVLGTFKILSRNKFYCVNGLIQSINAILGATARIFEENCGIEYLITSPFDQDALENFFFKILAPIV